MAKRLFVLLTTFFILAGCRMGSNDAVSSTITTLPPILSTSTTASIFTPTLLGTPTISPDAIRYQCLDVADHPPSNYILKGTLIYNNDDNTDAFLWNNDIKKVYRFPREEGDRLLEFNVSPDQKHIVYLHSGKTKDQLVIATADGQPIWSQIISSYLWDWFDNERLIHLEVSENGTHALYLLNPLNGERQDLRADFPDSEMFSNDWYPNWRYLDGGLPVYDPMLTRVIYPETDPTNKLGWPIILWDLGADHMVTRIMTMDNWGETPIWTPDGKQFIIALKIDPSDPYPPANEFFAVSRDGEVSQLTHFMDYFQEINILDSYSLSPNGRLLAFWIIAQPSQYDDARLAVLNIETGEVINYCIGGGPFMDNATTPSEPIWSPDGTQLLVISRNPEDTNIRRVVLVDLVQEYAAQIGEDIKPVGWMVAP